MEPARERVAIKETRAAVTVAADKNIITAMDRDRPVNKRETAVRIVCIGGTGRDPGDETETAAVRATRNRPTRQLHEAERKSIPVPKQH